MLGLYGFCGCKGLQPSKSIVAIEVLLGSGGRPVFIGFPRLRGTAARQVNNTLQSLDRDP